ncbi:hypothetical protein TPA0598_08_00140 [Streptomyces lydicamycinicus]|uniref:Uncharacterized protein n=1 Tax=Streptomyces lydicamycinicus TaxID=1546107 RepID=A0A0P4RD45_9ACTN|nr:hypothetical protein TPA0598_08_00140 [Streptomyces lydicamycinicus]
MWRHLGHDRSINCRITDRPSAAAVTVTSDPQYPELLPAFTCDQTPGNAGPGNCRIPGRDAPGTAEPRSRSVGKGCARRPEPPGVGCRVLRVVEEHQIRLAPEVLGYLLDGDL